jgi:CubicO group peptidase (beta-lactamase class C family)
MRVTALLLAVAGTLCPPAAHGQSAGRSALRGLDAVDSMVAAEYAKDSVGSLTVGVISGAELAWTRSVGFADMSTRRLADRQTVYRIGSITKPFTAVMLLQLVATGKVQLSDPVVRYLPEVSQLAGAPSGAAPFTFLQLATMTAGLAREPDAAGDFWSGPVSSWDAKVRAALPHTRYISAPGTEFSYSNIGYAILGVALQRAAGQSYLTWQRTHVLEPVGMQHTRFEVDASIARDLALGYEVRRDGSLDAETAQDEARVGRGYKVPNGAIFTTVDDLARFVSFELGRAPESVLPHAVLDDAFGGLLASDRFLQSGYGLGFMAMRRGDYAYLGHNGSVAGYRAAMYYNRTRQLGVIVLRNVVGDKQDTDRLAVDILSRLDSAIGAQIQADIDRRVKSKEASPGSEAAVRRIIEELRNGRPDYARMSTDLARAVRRALAEHRATMAKLGALQSLTFTGVGAAGPNIFRAQFERGTLEWRIWLNLDGRVDLFNFRAIPPP